ncbi:MAG: hypothetical protein IIB13_06845 [Chloroflexi bacterium]|nr:hypothetical protein [Chloroflexota bacterium]
MDWTTMGAPPPMVTSPIRIGLLVRLVLVIYLTPCVSLPLGKGFALKERHQCHPERSEGSRDGGDYL